jgi:CheY-like chemotaxis protein
LNLLGNAIKFTHRGEVVLEVLSGTRDTLLFSVRDSGIGIPADKLKAIFEPFRQVDGSTTREYGGTGLGLSISSKLVGMMGSSIHVESEPLCGSRFWFEIQAPSVEGEAPAGPASPSRIQKSAEPVDILLAEDNPINQRLAVRLLEKMGHHVTVAQDGAETVAKFQSGHFDVILMDVQMPVMSGFEATQRIRESERISGSHIPIVALTAHAISGDRERCLDAGMDDYLSKPIQIHELEAALQRVAPRTAAMMLR